MLGSRRLEQDDVALIIAKGDIAIAHKACSFHVFVGGESSDFMAGENVPHNCSVPGIVTNCKPSRRSFTRVVHVYPYHIFAVQLESPFDGKCIMVKD